MTREEFEYAIKSCGCFIYRGHIYYEESELIKAFEDLGLIHIGIEQEPKYCDRNICTKNEYNGIGCDECEVTKSDENLHREREQAYMQGYEDASKRFRQEPCDDAISRQAVLEYIEGSEAELGHSSENELVCQYIKELPPVTPQPCDDAISRKAVLDYIYNDLGLGDEENGKDVERQMELERSYKYVKSLSSVNPQPICEEREKGECPYYAG